MSILQIQILGKRADNSATDNSAELIIVETYIVGSVVRGEPEGIHQVALDENKLIEFTFDDDTVWFGDHTTLDEVFPGTATQLRSLEQQPGENVFLLPNELYVDEQSRSGLFSKIILKVVKIFTKKIALSPLVNKLASELEKKQLDNRSGLYQLTNTFKFNKPLFGVDGKYLLFLHGTASSTEGSFGELKGATVWSYINQTYGNNVLAFEHESLTKSPLENVLDLVRQLPQKASITLISHSRGGLVGDILNRFCATESAKSGFSDKEKNYLRKHKRDKDLENIEAIEKIILNKNITVDKFIRVACTASGTTLASRRLNIYFNVIFNVVGLATGQSSNPIYAAFKELIAALIESKDDASILPGLEVQNPRSPFNQMLNNANPDAIISSPLVVISGDAKLSLRWQAMKVMLSNLFFWTDNDFVVDTRSMYNGAKRAADSVQYFFDAGASVSHFNYFKNEKTQNALLLALRNNDNKLIPGFAKLESRKFTEEEIRNINFSLPGGRVFQDTVTGKRPIVVLLPGIMGSTLAVNEQLVWINFLGFVGGSLTRLQHSIDNNKNVRADGLVASSYKKLVDYLKRDYDVVTFPFDWRSNMAESAASLNRKIEQLMEYDQPIKLIGHSMGGVVIRDFIINHTSTWEKLKVSKNFRLVFLGSPLKGSFRIPYVLFGLDAIIKKLDFVDFANTQRELIEIFSQFPGLLSLLPLTDDENISFANTDTWDKMRKAFGEIDWPIPDPELLAEFKAYQSKVLDASKNIEFDHAVYIAGQSPKGKQTISGYRITSKNSHPVLEFLATKEGDESVTWESGIPATMIAKNNVYYSDVTHGELANDPKLFGAITDLLNNGTTTQLKKTRPALRSLEKEFKAKEIFDFDLSPQGVENTLLGLNTETQFAASDVPIAIFVSNGDLKYAMYPLLVGHFEMDGILSAERAIDYYLEGELSRRHSLGLYPGAIGTSESVLTNQARGFKGAIVIGLGKQGLLTEHRLTTTVEQGVSKYLADLNCKKEPPQKNSQKTKRIGITILLIGSNYGGLSIENSIRAILQGVQNANLKVRQLYPSPKVIDTIEFGELYRDRALACIKALSAIERDETKSLNIIISGDKIKENIGWRERLPIDNTTEWWTRINVRRYRDEELGDGIQSNHLLFAISTDAARVEERSLTTVNDTLLEMLEELSKNDEWSPELAKSIFELMIPNDFKDQIKRQSNINWIVDKYTASFPWELLQDSLVNAKPFSVNAGMIRQLATGDYRINVSPVVERTAIVIGDPDLNNPAIQLPAAFTEGERVGDLLCTQGFKVNCLLKKKAPQILKNLFNNNYKIVHLAGHGIFNSNPKEPTGMLIGPDTFLTPAYIDQMSSVPELVFVNCCYLGQTDGTTEKFSRNRFRLAANIGTQLIEIGVKAVVVAGWAVNDNAALDFAERFYESMFEGHNFGDAIQKARKTVFENYGGKSNTWGAYQCYGDPFYRLSSDPLKNKEVYDFIISEEAEIELSNLLNKVERGGADPETTLQTMDAIENGLAKACIRSGRIIELQALLYSALNQYKRALEKFEALWKEEKATYSFSATEKYCNTKVKWHALQVKQAKKDGKNESEIIQTAMDAIQGAIANLERLNCLGETAERLNLLGSAHKRLAIVSNHQDKKEAYKCAASFYKKAYITCGTRSKYYSLTNWVSIEYALVNADALSWGEKLISNGINLQEILKNQAETYTPPGIEDLQKELTNELKKVHLKEEEEKEYWDWIAEANILLCQLLLGDMAIIYDNILEQYTSAWAVIGSEGQRQAEIEHLIFLEDALEMGGEKSKENLQLVSRLRMELELLV